MINLMNKNDMNFKILFTLIRSSNSKINKATSMILDKVINYLIGYTRQ